VGNLLLVFHFSIRLRGRSCGNVEIFIAAEPFAGTWKLNLEKSKYKTGTPPKEQTATIAEAGSDLEVTISVIAADGTTTMAHYIVPAQGGEGKIIQSPYESVSGKRMGPNQLDITLSKGGKVALTAHNRISADGKTRTINVSGTGAETGAGAVRATLCPKESSNGGQLTHYKRAPLSE
jgi:hypothetical protein